MKTLIVDDQPVIRKILERILSRFGSCDFAAHGLEAVEAFQNALRVGKPYDLVCMDIEMPVMDGHHALSRIREIEERSCRANSSRAVIFMISTLDSDAHISRALFGEGCNDYITKPFSETKIVLKLGEHGLA
ncbi:MAG: response regulator [Magnetococcales bacterium]|nr:response regulator [Magnetococcales bacterium]MBF0321471.1 response regulator [Magnetococcales bacterium]